MKQQSLQDRIAAELEYARGERAQGNEGRARVCARRAAGWAVAAYRQRHYGVEPHTNVYQILRWYQSLADVSEKIRMAAARLTVRVTPSHELPHQEDPLEDAQAIVQALLEELD